MARFMVKVPGHEDLEMPAETCEVCKGIGYLTKTVTFKSQKLDEDTTHLHRAESGDRCPLCIGRGWVGIVGGGLGKP